MALGTTHGAEVGVVSQGVHVQRRQEGLRARAFAQGQAHLNKLVRDGTLFAFVEMGQARRRMALHQQRRRASTRDFETCSRHHRGLPLLHRAKAIFGGVMRTPARFRSRNPTRHANRRRCGRAVRRSVEPESKRGRRSGRNAERGSSGRSSICPRDTGGE